jgi:hypothetical protein
MALVLVASACTTPEGGGSSGVGIDAVLNMTYTVGGTEYALVDGIYSEPAAPGSATMDTVAIYEKWVAFGDLNGDGVGDAAVVLYHDPGGSGTFRYLAAVVDEDGEAVNRDTTSLGDRVRINSLRVDGGEIQMDVVTHGETDPMCCPTDERKWTYELQNGKLVQTADEQVGKVEGEPSGSPPTITMSVKPRQAIIGEKVDIYVHAYDSPGIAKIELYQEGDKFEQEWTAPTAEGVPYVHHTFVWRNATDGNHEFQAKAIDVDDNEGWSDKHIVKVRENWDEVELHDDESEG